MSLMKASQACCCSPGFPTPALNPILLRLPMSRSRTPILIVVGVTPRSLAVSELGGGAATGVVVGDPAAAPAPPEPDDPPTPPAAPAPWAPDPARAGCGLPGAV